MIIMLTKTKQSISAPSTSVRELAHADVKRTTSQLHAVLALRMGTDMDDAALSQLADQVLQKMLDV